jgi:hypothetical protein
MFGLSAFAAAPFASLTAGSEQAFVFVTGQFARAILGPLSLGANGLQANALLNSVIVSIPIQIPLTGVYATAYLGDGTTATAGGYAITWRLVDTTQHP